MSALIPEDHPKASVKATSVAVAADATNGVDAGTLQEVVSALAARVKVLEDAAAV